MKKDFFVSYNSNDRAWAEWIAWTLEEAGYSVIIQAWDFRPGGNFVLDMQRAAQNTERTIAILSDHYLQAEYTQPEWAAAFAKDPRAVKRSLIPIRIQTCEPDGILGTIGYADLVGCSPTEATNRVKEILNPRVKPLHPPDFPEPAMAMPPTSETTHQRPSLSLGVYGWDSYNPGPVPTVELDWRDDCDRPSRKIPSAETWDTDLFPQLDDAKQTLAEISPERKIELLGNRPLTMSLAVGFTFPAVAGYQFWLQQTTGGKASWWTSSAHPSEARFKIYREHGMEGEDLIVAIGISRAIWDAVSQFYREHSADFNALVYVEPEQGAGQQTLNSDADAVALAIHAKELIAEYRRQYRAKRVHLILACPASFALFLGQHLNALGQIFTYEQKKDESYQASVQIHTG